MHTSPSVRGALVLPLVIAVFGTLACTGSPTQPDLIDDATTGSRPRSFEASPSFSPTELVEEEFGEADFDEQELTDESELTEDAGDVEEVDATDLDESDFDPQSLTGTTLTSAATARTVVLTGIIKDQSTRRVISGVTVKITGLKPVTSDSRGRYRINVRTGTRTLKFSKKGYATTSVTRNVARAMTIDVLMTATGGALSSVSLSGNDVPVGTVVNGTVTLNNAAPSGGAKISLSSTSPATAAVVSSMTIQGGKKTGTFQVNAKAAGTAVIKATYNNASKTANLKVTGGDGDGGGGGDDGKFVAAFTYGDPCPIVLLDPNDPPQLIAKCTFDASASKAPTGSKYEWTLPDGSVIAENDSKLTNAPLKCGLPTVAFPAPVKLTVIGPGGVRSTVSLTVNFEKSGLC